MTKIVNSLLAIAASSSVLLAQGGGWMGGPGKGLSFDGGDAFGLKISNQLQTHWNYSTGDTATVNNFSVRRARTSLSGHAYKKSIRYKLMVDAVDDGAGGGGANGSLKDGHVTWTFLSNDSADISLRMGQGKTQYGLEATGTSKGLMFIDRSLAARTGSDTRSTGAWVQGSHMENKLRWTAGAMNGSAVGLTSTGEQAANDDDELSWVFGADFDPMGDYTGGKGNESLRQGDFRTEDRSLCGTVGAAIALENSKPGGAGTPDTETQSINVHTAWSVEGFQFMGEFFDSTAETQGAADIEADGFAVSGTWVMPASGDSSIQWAFGLRISQMDLTDPGIGGDEVTDISVVANAFYHGHACKTQFEITQRDRDLASTSDTLVGVAFQLLF